MKKRRVRKTAPSYPPKGGAGLGIEFLVLRLLISRQHEHGWTLADLTDALPYKGKLSDVLGGMASQRYVWYDGARYTITNAGIQYYHVLQRQEGQE